MTRPMPRVKLPDHRIITPRLHRDPTIIGHHQIWDFTFESDCPSGEYASSVSARIAASSHAELVCPALGETLPVEAAREAAEISLEILRNAK